MEPVFSSETLVCTVPTGPHGVTTQKTNVDEHYEILGRGKVVPGVPRREDSFSTSALNGGEWLANPAALPRGKHPTTHICVIYIFSLTYFMWFTIPLYLTQH
jgi:hypothetical protein